MFQPAAIRPVGGTSVPTLLFQVAAIRSESVGTEVPPTGSRPVPPVLAERSEAMRASAEPRLLALLLRRRAIRLSAAGVCITRSGFGFENAGAARCGPVRPAARGERSRLPDPERLG
ncbi:DUF6053 domain-containing protein [Lysobacter enzymogenes]|uniref:DUF6053 domain-containing protein n=1 Tax=Lysobacter enzymogenes TaxID=69 RepID=UPI0033939265